MCSALFTQSRDNASRGIYILHDLPQNSTKDCGSWIKVTCLTSKTGRTQQIVINDTLSIQPVSPVNLVNLNSLYQVKMNKPKLNDKLIGGTNREWDPKALETSDCHKYRLLLP